MLRCTKSKLGAILLLGVSCFGAQAEIVIDYATVSPPGIGFGQRLMPGIVIQTEPQYHVQRARAWRGYQRTDPKTGAMLVYPAQIGAIGAPSSLRQAEVRNNISRAHAYRLENNRK